MAPSPPSFWPVILHTLTHFRCPQGFLTVFKLIHQAVSFTFTLELFQIEYWKRVTSHFFLQSCISHYLYNIRMLQILFYFFFIFRFETCRILVPQPGMEPKPPGVEAWGVVTTGPLGKPPVCHHCHYHVCVKLLQACLTLCYLIDYSLPGSSVHGILQARILEWVSIPSSRRSANPGIKPISLMSPTLADGFFTTSTTWEAPEKAQNATKLKVKSVENSITTTSSFPSFLLFQEVSSILNFMCHSYVYFCINAFISYCKMKFIFYGKTEKFKHKNSPLPFDSFLCTPHPHTMHCI